MESFTFKSFGGGRFSNVATHSPLETFGLVALSVFCIDLYMFSFGFGLWNFVVLLLD